MSSVSDNIHDGIYVDIRRHNAAALPRQPAVFLDRDGVIVELVDYLHDPADVRLTADAGAAIAALNRAGLPVVVVTNQSGIGRGLYDWEAFVRTQAEVDRLLSDCGGWIDAVAACPFHADARPPYDWPDHPCRKPNPGMLTILRNRLALALEASWIVGDHRTDIETARRAGLAGAVHVLTGHGPSHRAAVRNLPAHGRRLLFADSLAAAIPHLLNALPP
ncbi:MAG: D-glycero-alpha-D-manno-heptose-1,7-bisphosphate 7-phosphatase [Phycisphaerae bacterium]